MDNQGELLSSQIKRLEYSFYACARKLGSEIAESMEDELTPYQYLLLQILSKRGACTPSLLAKELRVKPGAITAMLDRLSKRDCIVRVRNEADRRAVNIAISPAGIKVLKECERKRAEILGYYLSQMESKEIDKMVILIEKLTHIVLFKEEKTDFHATKLTDRKQEESK